MLRAAGIAAISAAMPAAVASQVVVGTVVGGDGVPVPAALVEVRDSAGVLYAGGLAGPDGRFVLRVAAPGVYRLHVTRIGFAQVTTPYFRLGAGESVRRRVEASAEPVLLTGITVATDQRCRAGPPSGGDLARVWEQARAALTAVSLTEASPLVSFRIVTRTRRLSVPDHVVLTDSVRAARSMGVYPFRSIPLDSLLDHGFTALRGDTVVYFGPDAEVLLSPGFLDRYCFGLTRSPTANEVGLAFAPVRTIRGRTEVEGALWLDADSAALRRLEYHYVNQPWGAGARQATGELRFERLENGAWIVRSWSIRAPATGYPRPRRGRRPDRQRGARDQRPGDRGLRPAESDHDPVRAPHGRGLRPGPEP